MDEGLKVFGISKVVADAFAQAASRGPQHLRNWIVLVDGARHQLDLIQDEAARRGIHLNILLDFVHVAEYTWTAAHALHPVGSRKAETWAADKLTAILAGQADRAAHEMTAQAASERLPAGRRAAVTTCAATSPVISTSFTTTPPSRPAGRRCLTA